MSLQVLYFALALATFFVGGYILMTKKNLIRIMMGIEMMILSAQALFIIYAKYAFPNLYDPLLQTVLILFTVVAAGIVAVFMVLVYVAYSKLGTINVEDLKKLRW